MATGAVVVHIQTQIRINACTAFSCTEIHRRDRAGGTDGIQSFVRLLDGQYSVSESFMYDARRLKHPDQFPETLASVAALG
jgi:hypothetical protein